MKFSRKKGKKRGFSVRELAARAKAEENRAAKRNNLEVEYDTSSISQEDSTKLYGRDTERRLKRAIVARIFVLHLKCPPPDTWNGRGGAISIARQIWQEKYVDDLVVPKYATFRSQFAGLNSLMEQGQPFEISGSDARCKNGGHNKLVKSGSAEEQLIADSMERGLGLTQTMHIVNAWLARNGKDLALGRSAVYSAVQRLNPQVIPVQARPQGSTDPNSDWARARCRLVHQLLRRLRDPSVLNWQQTYEVSVPSSWVPGATLTVHTQWGEDMEVQAPPSTAPAAETVQVSIPTPEYFQLDNLPRIELTQIAFWDETHKEVQVGNKKCNVRFRRNKHGRLDPRGKFLPPETFLKMKYTEQARLCLGVAIVQNSAEQPSCTGVRCLPYDYTDKWIVGVAKYNEMMHAEIRRVQAMSDKEAKTQGFLCDDSDTGIFLNDPVTKLPGIGKATAAKLSSAHVYTVQGALATAETPPTNEECTALGVDPKAIAKLVMAVKKVEDQVMPRNFDVTDFRKAANPFEARYGDQWRLKIAETKSMRKHECVTKMWLHVLQETAKVFQGTTHEDDWLVYHDALTHLTDKSTVAWMKTHTIDGRPTSDESTAIYCRWLLPMKGLNDGGRYASRPVGNSPELMPLDCSLFKDLDDAVDRHIAVTSSLPDTNVKKFSKRTPKLAASSYKRVWEGVPSSKRIIQDISRCWGDHLRAIREARGCMVPGIGNHTGRRWVGGVHKRGGLREKKPVQVNAFLHVDAREGLAAIEKLALAVQAEQNGDVEICSDGCVSPGGGDCGGGSSKPSSMPTTPLRQITNNTGW